MFGRQQNDAGGIAGLGSLSQGTGAGIPGSSALGGAAASSRAQHSAPAADGRPRRSAGRIAALVAGWALFIGGFAAGGWAIYELMSYGSCASGGPYVSARECAPGTGLKIMSIFGSTFAVLIGTGLIGSWRAASAAWGVLFTGLGAMFIFGMALGPDADLPSMKAVGFGVGGLFLLMGLPGLWAAVRPPTGRERRQVRIRGAYGTELSVDRPEDGGPAAVVMANVAAQPGADAGGFVPPYPGWPNPPQGPAKDLR